MAELEHVEKQLIESSDASDKHLVDPSVVVEEGTTTATITTDGNDQMLLDEQEPIIIDTKVEKDHSNRTTPTSPHHLTIINPSAGTVSSSESISEEEYLERLHEKYSQTPSSELGISSFSTFGSMNTTYFHTETSISSESTLTPKKSEGSITASDFVVDLCYQNTDTGNCELEEGIKSPEDDEALDLLVGTGTVQHSSEPIVSISGSTDDLLGSTSQPTKVPPPFHSKKSQVEAEKMEMSKFHLPPVPTFKKKPPPLQTHQSKNIIVIATPSPPSSLKLILQQYNVLHHSVVHLTLSNKNQKIIVPMINSNVNVLARSASLESSLTNIFEEKVPVKVFQNSSNNSDDIYLSTQSGNQRITPLELDCKNPVLCLKSLEDILFVTTVLPLSNFQVEEVTISNGTTQSVHQFHKVRAKDPQESQVIIFATDTHIEIPLTENDEFIIEDIGRLTAFEESVSVCPHGEHYLIRGPGSFWLKTEIII